MVKSKGTLVNFTSNVGLFTLSRPARPTSLTVRRRAIPAEGSG